MIPLSIIITAFNIVRTLTHELSRLVSFQYFFTTPPAWATPPAGRRDPSSYEEGNYSSLIYY